MNYKRLGNYIQEVNERDTNMSVTLLLGVSIQKKFIPSIANIIGTDMSTYKIVRQNQFAYGPVTSRNGDKVSIALLDDYEEAIVSQAYIVFKITDTEQLLPEYLMMWFRRPEFDRYARFKSHGSAREIFDWDELGSTYLPVPDIDKQREIIKEYHTITNRIALNKQLIGKLEATAQAIYKQWFVDFEFPDENGQPYKSNGGEMIDSELGEIPKGWEAGKLQRIANQTMGFAFDGESYSTEKGISVLRGENVSEKFLRWDNHKKWNENISPRMEKCYLQDRDIVIGMDGSKVGKNWAMVSKYDLPLLLAQRVSCLRGKDTYYQNFIFYSMCVLDFPNYVSQVQTGTSIPHISGQQIFDFSLVIPKEEILKEFDYLISKIVTLKSEVKQEQEKLSEMTSLLLSKLATIEEPIHG